MATLWTLGYEGRTPADVANLLQAARIQRVVDVRKLPLSRKKGFSKKALAATLDAHGIGYTHKPELGVDKPVRAAYQQSGDFAPLARWYQAHLRQQGASIAGLLQMVEQERVCLLCFEADHEACHRSILADRLGEAGTQARHL